LKDEPLLKMNSCDLYFGGVPNIAFFTADIVEIYGI